MYNRSEITSRAHLGTFFEEHRRSGYGAEIGTHQGYYAEELLNQYKGTLYCVDNWKEYDEEDPSSHTDRAEDKEQTIKRLHRFGERACIIAQSSRMATRLVKTHSLDFVYLDAGHRYDDVWQDLNLWWPKIHPGGYMSGHDIIMPCCYDHAPDNWGRYIQPAVEKFVQMHGVPTIWLIPEGEKHPWSYIFQKP